MPGDFEAALRMLEEHGWARLDDVDPSEEQEVRQRFREAQRDAGWHVRTSYDEPTRSVGVARTYAY